MHKRKKRTQAIKKNKTKKNETKQADLRHLKHPRPHNELIISADRQLLISCTHSHSHWGKIIRKKNNTQKRKLLHIKNNVRKIKN